MKTTELLKQASEIEKKAYTDYVTSFSQGLIVNLVKGGMPFEKAASVAEEACQKDSKAISLVANIEAFEKAAEYIAELEAKVEELTKVAGEAVLEAEKADEKNPLHKLASIGFTDEEIAMLSQLPENLVEKVASNSNDQPWGMGGAVGIPREKTDPLLEFLLG